MNSTSIVPVLAFVTATAGLLAVAQVLSEVLLRDRTKTNDRVDAEFSHKRAEQTKKTPLFKNLGQVAAELSDPNASPSIRQRFESMIEQSGLDTTPKRVLLTAGAMAVGFGSLDFFFRQNPIEALIVCFIGGLLPIYRVKKTRDRRLEKLRSQLADAFDLMARVIRAGQTLGQSLLAVADEFPQPIAGEFAQCYEQQNLGLSPEASFRDLNRRTGVIELKIFVLAVLVQQQSGGNLAELLGKLANIVRERYHIRGTINTLTAEGKMQGWILAALPPSMLVILMVANWSYAKGHFAPEHRNLLMYTFAVEGLGVLWIRKIINFDF